MLFAEVIVPLTIDQAYVVAPAGPAAELPTELAQTCAGVGVMVGVAGLALMVTLAVLLAEQLIGKSGNERFGFHFDPEIFLLGQSFGCRRHIGDRDDADRDLVGRQRAAEKQWDGRHGE